MKKVILTTLLLASTAFAADAVAPVFRPESVSTKTNNNATVTVNTVCLSGFVFAVASQEKSNTSNGAGGVALVQVYQPGFRGNPVQPITCSK
jgi:hypothetical protein